MNLCKLCSQHSFSLHALMAGQYSAGCTRVHQSCNAGMAANLQFVEVALHGEDHDQLPPIVGIVESIVTWSLVRDACYHAGTMLACERHMKEGDLQLKLQATFTDAFVRDT